MEHFLGGKTLGSCCGQIGRTQRTRRNWLFSPLYNRLLSCEPYLLNRLLKCHQGYAFVYLLSILNVAWAGVISTRRFLFARDNACVSACLLYVNYFLHAFYLEYCCLLYLFLLKCKNKFWLFPLINLHLFVNGNL